MMTMIVDASTFPVDASNLNMRIDQAERYLKEFEAEVARSNWASGRFFSKDDALSRIKVLMDYDGNDPRIVALYDRAKACLKGSKGGSTEVDPAMTRYLVNEENMRKHFAQIAQAKWESMLAEKQADMLDASVYPDPKQVRLAAVENKYVVLDEVEYPRNQFYGATGEYIKVGSRLAGMYFLRIDSRSWLGPYEAVKRYRREVDATMQEVRTWKVLGRITTVTVEQPEAGEKKVGPAVMAWVVEPEVLYVPEHTAGVYDPEKELAGYFVGEDEVAAIKDSWFTVREVPDDVTPERLMEIFMTAIKEKNLDLYRECIHPDMKVGSQALDNIMYHWDLHQERFHGEYVHATFDPKKTVIAVVKGFDDRNELEDFFLDEDEKEKLNKIYGDKIEYAYVESVAYTDTGKQLGSPNKHTCQRNNNGRWYVRDYDIRF